MLFFPEGTRSEDGRVKKFKRGAFTVAAKEGARVVPIAIRGTHKLMPRGREMRLAGGADVTLHVKPPLDGSKSSAQELRDASQEVIAQDLE